MQVEIEVRALESGASQDVSGQVRIRIPVMVYMPADMACNSAFIECCDLDVTFV